MITVITATYNHALYLRGAVESVRSQLCRDWEHVIIDDGSTDETPDVLCRLYQDSPDRRRLRLFRTRHQGFVAALNAGLARARGEWVAFLDSDDEYLPDHLGLMLATAEGKGMALGRFIVVNCSGQPRPTVPDFYHPGREIEVEHIESATGLLFVRRELILGQGGFRAVPSSDTDLFNRLKQAGHGWNRAGQPSYLYFYGRVRNHMAHRELQADRKGR